MRIRSKESHPPHFNYMQEQRELEDKLMISQNEAVYAQNAMVMNDKTPDRYINDMLGIAQPIIEESTEQILPN